MAVHNLQGQSMSCCDYGKCVQGWNCPVRQANRELQKSSKTIRRVQAGKIPPPDIKPEYRIEYEWGWSELMYTYGLTMSWVILFSFVAGIFLEIL